MKVVVRLGGSVIASPPDAQIMQRYAELLGNMKKQGHRLVVVAGGGSIARDFIKIAKDLGLGEPDQDEIAISVSRLFAQLLAMKLDALSSKTIPRSVNEAVESFRRGKTVVMGGLKPGMTTDAVAAMVADRIAADSLVKASDVDGVYTKDPKKHPDAKKFDKLRFDDLGRLFEFNTHKAGIHQILDPEAVKILQKCKIRMVIVNGFTPENVLLALEGGEVGTLIE